LSNNKEIDMPRFAANLTMLFTEHPFLDRFEHAARAGFKAVEFLFPYAYPAQEIHQRLVSNNLELILHNLPAGNWEGGERGIACDPQRVNEFRQGVDQAIEYAQRLGVKQINCLAGKRPENTGEAQLKDTLVANLSFAAAALKKEGIGLLIEPINPFDIPGFYLNSTSQAASLLADVANDNLLIQYDIYHAQRVEGELAATIEKYLPQIGHIQLADNPRRGEPGTGEINYPFLFKHLDKLNYPGWIGCEYKPLSTTKAGLSWLGWAAPEMKVHA
jgi:hydroxypyruvate isomerase